MTRLCLVSPFSTKAALSNRILNIRKRLGGKVLFYESDKYGQSELLCDHTELIGKRRGIFLPAIRIIGKAWKSDVVILFKPFPQNVIAAMFLKLCGKLIIFDFDEWDPFTELAYRKRVGKITYYFMTFLSYAASKIADGIVVANKRLLDMVQSENAVIVPNSIDTKAYSQCRPRLSKNLIYSGSLHYKDLLLPYFLRTPSGMTLTIIGDGKDREEILSECHKHGIKTTYLGYAPPERIPELFRTLSGIFLAPYPKSKNIEFGSSGKIPEYMASGCPIISTKNSLTSELLGGGEFGYLVENEEEVPETLARILRDPSEALQKAKQACIVVRERYNWDTNVEQIKSLISRLSAK